jgi:hypothetical protein
MQLGTQPWTMDTLMDPYDPRHRSVRFDPCGGALRQCHRCDILLGTQPCPHPACRVP